MAKYSASSSSSLREIHEEIRELRTLYKQLLDRLVPVEEPTQEEKKAIEETDEIADEKELRKALGFRSRD
jgi:archaellum component FlaC